jgi:hypothetical protein
MKCKIKTKKQKNKKKQTKPGIPKTGIPDSAFLKKILRKDSVKTAFPEM